MTGLALLALASGAQAAEPLTAEQATENYRRLFPKIDQADCPPAVGPELVICGRRDANERMRLPLPVETPGRRESDRRFTTSELLTLNPDDKCFSNKGCAKATSPIIPAVLLAIEVAKKIIDPDR